MPDTGFTLPSARRLMQQYRGLGPYFCKQKQAVPKNSQSHTGTGFRCHPAMERCVRDEPLR